MSYPRAAAIAARLDVVAETGSTNADLGERAADAAAWPHLSVLLTTNQRAGRGRLDRTWETPPGSALAVSVLLRGLQVEQDLRGWIPLAAGVAMADAIAAQLRDRDVVVKWPNDVLVDGQKICGILAEAVSTEVIVVGAGVNTAMTEEQLPVPSATSFAVVGATSDDDRLIADYLTRLDALLSALAESGDAIRSGLHATVTSRCSTLGQDVKVTLPGGDALSGRATRLEADGRLVVEADGTPHVIGAGDVIHVRLAQGS